MANYSGNAGATDSRTGTSAVTWHRDESASRMSVLKMVYRAGFTNPCHSHPCAPSVYALAGTPNTDHDQYTAGTFGWFLQRGAMEHGAAQDDDCAFSFIASQPFGIHYAGDDSNPAASRA